MPQKALLALTDQGVLEGKLATTAMKSIETAREERARANFFETLEELLKSFREAFPDCLETREWILWYDNLVKDDAKKKEEGLRRWLHTMESSLSKGSAKYAKAVQHITGKPAVVYHAIAYHDAVAANASSDYFEALDFPGKLKTMDTASANCFWGYMDDLNAYCFAALRRTPPAVPTAAEISANIAQRKNKASDTPVLRQSVNDLWRTLCKECNADAPPPSTFPPRFEERCRERDASVWEEVWKGSSSPEGAPTEAQWDLLQRISALTTVESAIPQDMMAGIESVANKLVMDMQQGKTDLGSLDVEAIGQQVLSQVSQDEIASFANNMDKILPALECIAPAGFPGTNKGKGTR